MISLVQIKSKKYSKMQIIKMNNKVQNRMVNLNFKMKVLIILKKNLMMKILVNIYNNQKILKMFRNKII